MRSKHFLRTSGIIIGILAPTLIIGFVMIQANVSPPVVALVMGVIILVSLMVVYGFKRRQDTRRRDAQPTTESDSPAELDSTYRVADETADSSSQRDAFPEAAITPSTWMVVEDEPDIYETLLAMFEMWGIEGVSFVDGEEAVAWIDDVDNGRFQSELPELALLDIRLPGDINGAMVGERLRNSPVLGDIAIVLITAYRLSPDEEKAIIKQAGADRLIYKPLPHFNEFQSSLEDIIVQRRKKARQPASE